MKNISRPARPCQTTSTSGRRKYSQLRIAHLQARAWNRHLHESTQSPRAAQRIVLVSNLVIKLFDLGPRTGQTMKDSAKSLKWCSKTRMYVLNLCFIFYKYFDAKAFYSDPSRSEYCVRHTKTQHHNNLISNSHHAEIGVGVAFLAAISSQSRARLSVYRCPPLYQSWLSTDGLRIFNHGASCM